MRFRGSSSGTTLRYEDIDLWEIHEAFAAQVLANVAALEDKAWIKRRTGIDRDFGPFPWDRVNPNGSSIAIGHPFAATGARDLSQCVKELFAMPSGFPRRRQRLRRRWPGRRGTARTAVTNAAMVEKVHFMIGLVDRR